MKRKRIVTIVIVSVVVLAAAAAGVLYTQGVFGSNKSSTATYTIDKLKTGDIEKSVTGTGTLASGSAVTVSTPVDLTIDTVAVNAGQTVKAGDTLATIDQDSLADTISTLQTEISSTESSIARQVSSETSAGNFTSLVSGRVKQILCSVGSDADSTASDKGGLFLLSTDGKMKVTITLAKADGVSVGTSVKVKTGSYTYTGKVESLSSDGTTATVTLTDDGTDLGATATVYKTSSTLLGSGKLEINRPYYVPATTGTVSKIYVSVDSKVSTRTKLAYLMGKDVSDTYASLEKTLAQEQGLLKKALDLQRSGVLTAPQDGTVKSLSIVDGQAVKQDGAVALMLTLDSYELDVSVDELDINSVSVGQDASVAVDAVSSKTFDGAVQSISQIGSTSNGVTTYTVAIKMAADSSLKVGMNATATIVIEKHANVLLMPIEALNTIMGNSYVWLYTGTLPTDSSKDPGTRTEVKTGLSNDNYVEITSGLTASDQVVVVRTKSTTGTTTTSQNSIFSGMGGMGGTMPSGVQMPSGGFPGGGSGGN